MPFVFLKYLQPTHYFRLKNLKGDTVFPKVEALPESVLEKLEQDSNYLSSHAKDYDISWQAIQLGYIGDAETYQSFNRVPVYDNYRFIRKHFHKAWVLYVLLLRVLSLHNPIKEIVAFVKTRHISRKLATLQPITYENYASFESNLLASKPLVSVVIPTLNRYAYLKNVLKDLEQQTYTNFEVIIVDQSEPFNPDFYKAFKLDIKYINQKEKALWLARNTAIKHAKGKLIALSEDDVRIKPDWIEAHIRCLDFFQVQVSAGVFYPEGQNIPNDRAFFSVASQFATGNAMLYKKVFNIVGLFDRQFEKQRMGDGEFGMRLFLEGIQSVSNPHASCVDVKAGVGGLREMGSWDAFRPSTFLAPRPIPSVIYFFRRYFGKKATRRALWRTVPMSVFPYQFKKNKAMLILAGVLSLVIAPVICLQVYRSWKLASIKLKQGPIIEKLSENH